MPKELDFVKATVLAYKSTLDSKPSSEKSGRVSIQLAHQFNSIVEKIKNVCPPEAASELPRPITWNTPAANAGWSDVKFLELEMMLNQVIAILDVLRADH
jgi:hypothetical protein